MLPTLFFLLLNSRSNALRALYEQCQIEAEEKGFLFTTGPWGNTEQEAREWFDERRDVRDNAQLTLFMPESTQRSLLANQIQQATAHLEQVRAAALAG